MAMIVENEIKDDIKTRFKTREGVYKLMPLSELSRANKIGFGVQVNTPVKVSFVRCLDSSDTNEDAICFNYGRELCIYRYKEIHNGAEPSKPIDKRVYKGTNPTCHDFNKLSVTSESILLIVGFSGGQIQLIDPMKREFSRLYNEERQIDNSKVTCLKWLPTSMNQFLASHSSGHLYVYSIDLMCSSPSPNYQLLKQGDGFSVHSSKTKTMKNPLYKWSIGEGSINEFSFSPCSTYLAVVSQDGFLRVFNFLTMELDGMARSYFGGFLCVSWSPDSKFIVMGGEDDLVTIWSLTEKHVVARGEGHKSWISVVKFDPYLSSWNDSTELNVLNNVANHGCVNSFGNCKSPKSSLHIERTYNKESNKTLSSYRIGSVGQDTYLCLWDLNEDLLNQPYCKHKTNVSFNYSSESNQSNVKFNLHENHPFKENSMVDSNANHKSNSFPNSLSHRFGISLNERKDKENVCKKWIFNGKTSDKVSLMKSFPRFQNSNFMENSIKYLGTPICPRLEDCPMLEPLICKKIAHERLTALLFCSKCIVTACQDGIINLWARPEQFIEDKMV